MATKSISQLDTQATANETDLFEVAIVDQNSASGYASKKESAAAIADAIVGEYQYPLRITGTTAKTIAGAINELKQLVDLLPQFAIEVVQTLPVSDISETTIYLVPASDPEQGNYYEEYIYVNNAWELVGTTAVDLSGYYTSAQTDTLLSAKANTADVSAALELKENSADMEEDVTDIVVDLTDTIETAEGNPVTLQTVQEGYAKAVTIKLTPKQNLHGYDKPWVGGAGKNQFDAEHANWKNSYYLDASDTEIANGAYKYTQEYIEVSPNTTYTFQLNKTSDLQVGISECFYDSNKSIIGREVIALTTDVGNVYGTFTTPTGCAYIRTNAPASSDNFQLELGSTATAYEPYANICPIEGYEEISATRTGVDGATATAEFSETIYGAEGDVAGGDWEKQWVEKIKLNTLNWQKSASIANVFYAALTEGYKRESSVNAMGSSYKYIGTKTGTSGMVSANSGEWALYVKSGSYVKELYLKNTNYTEATDFVNSLTDDDTICYELATPEPFQTAPAPLTLQKGNNTITTDGDSVKIKYNKLALPDIIGISRYISALEARIEALEGGSSSRSISVSPTLTKSLTSEIDETEGKAEEDTKETEEETKEEAQKNER